MTPDTKIEVGRVVGIRTLNGAWLLEIATASGAIFVKREDVEAALSYASAESAAGRSPDQRIPDPLRLQGRTPTPRTPSIRSQPFKRLVYEALWSWVHQGAVYRTFTISEALAAVMEAPKIQAQVAPFADTHMEPMVRESVQSTIKAKLDQAIWNAHGARAFYAIPQDDKTWRWVHLRGLTAEMVERLLKDTDANIRILREKRRVFEVFHTALTGKGGNAILDDVYVQVRDALGWKE